MSYNNKSSFKDDFFSFVISGTWLLSGGLARMLLTDCEQTEECCQLTISGMLSSESVIDVLPWTFFFLLFDTFVVSSQVLASMHVLLLLVA